MVILVNAIKIVFFFFCNYTMLWEHNKFVLPPLTWIVDFTINLINGTMWEREYIFIVLLEHCIITLLKKELG